MNVPKTCRGILYPSSLTCRPSLTYCTMNVDVKLVIIKYYAFFSETLDGMNVGGGVRQTTISDVSTCINTCLAAATCAGVDFDTRDNTCWFHTSATVCNTPRSKPGCTHFKLTLECKYMFSGPYTNNQQYT